jgi:hypothetical protein
MGCDHAQGYAINRRFAVDLAEGQRRLMAARSGASRTCARLQTAYDAARAFEIVLLNLLLYLPLHVLRSVAECGPVLESAC